MKKRTIIEPFKIKMVEPLVFLTREARERVVAEAGNNLFLVKSENVTFDFLTDSGTTAMSAAQWSAMMVADESYAGSRSFERFRSTVEKVDLVVDEGKDPSNPAPFKGNLDPVKLEKFCAEHCSKIPIGMITITNNTGGGQPVSMENLRQVASIYKKYEIPFIIDACRFAENSMFIKTREAEMGSRTVASIARETFDLADGCLMSAKKDAMSNIGGFIALRDDYWLADLRNLLILTEGFPTYGGLAARDLEAMAVGLTEVLDENYLTYRLAVGNYFSEQLNRIGIPTMLPAGGHAVYIDAKAFLPHIPPEQFPGQAFAVELYLAEGVRSCEIGSAMFGKFSGDVSGKKKFTPAAMELVRLAFPRRVYTQSQFDYIIEGFEDIAKNRERIRGLKLIYDPPYLRHFTARFECLPGK